MNAEIPMVVIFLLYMAAFASLACLGVLLERLIDTHLEIRRIDRLIREESEEDDSDAEAVAR